MVDSFFCLRHHVVIGSYDNDYHVSYLRTTCTHSRKCFVSRSIQERNATSILQFHVICTNVLCDTSGLTRNYICFTDIVQQRSLTVVYVTHHGNNRCTRLQIFFRISLFLYSLCYFRTYIFCLVAKFFCHKVNRFCIQTLVDRHHDTHTHTS